jgi:hypothetical protein
MTTSAGKGDENLVMSMRTGEHPVMMLARDGTHWGAVT